MSEAAQTLDGWYSLHDLRAMNWSAWKALSSDERQTAIYEFQQFINKLNQTQNEKTRQPRFIHNRWTKG